MMDKTAAPAGWMKATEFLLKPVASASKKLIGAGQKLEQSTGAAARIGGGALLGGAAGATQDEEGSNRKAILGAIAGGALGKFAPSLLKQTGEGLKTTKSLIQNPAETLRKGWRNQSQLAGSTAAKTRAESIEKSINDPGFFRKYFGGGQQGALDSAKQRFSHLGDVKKTKDGYKFVAKDSPTSFSDALKSDSLGGKIKGVAESLSQRGYTGSGAITKYVPWGGKGLTLGFAGLSLPSVAQAAKGEKSITDAATDVGSNLAYVAGASNPALGLLGSVGLAEGLRAGVGVPGRFVERRLRGGTLPGEAAPQVYRPPVRG